MQKVNSFIDPYIDDPVDIKIKIVKVFNGLIKDSTSMVKYNSGGYTRQDHRGVGEIMNNDRKEK